jgi:3-hydroxybutyryl-CoA dehydrogenase
MQVKQIAVVGAGVMGRGIAMVSALNGFSVKLYDISYKAAHEAMIQIQAEMNKGLERGFYTAEQVQSAVNSLVPSTSLQDGAQEADLVIEAVLEQMDLKIRIFQEADRYAPSHAILATNTSTMSPTEIGAATGRPERTVAMHFFNPVHKMKLIEIIRGLDTSDETVEQIRLVSAAMKKEVVEVNEFPGFVAGRMSCIVGNEAMNMLMQGVASAADIDKAIKLGLGYPMGPLELADLVGLDSRLRNLEYLHKTLGEAYRPCPLLSKYVKAGRLGKKSGRGIYEYDANGQILR